MLWHRHQQITTTLPFAKSDEDGFIIVDDEDFLKAQIKIYIKDPAQMHCSRLLNVFIFRRFALM